MTGPSPWMRLQVHLFSVATGVLAGIALCANEWCGTVGAGAVTVGMTFFVDYLILSHLHETRAVSSRSAFAGLLGRGDGR
jgi:hypothetical protein